MHRYQRSHRGERIRGDELDDKELARTVTEDRQTDVLCEVHTHWGDVVLRQRHQAAGDEKSIFIQ